MTVTDASPNVLVVDHDPRSTAHIGRILSQAGTEFRTVRSTAAAWQLLHSDPALSLVLVRFRGPGIEACGFCSRIRREPARNQTVILVMVGEDQMEQAAEALRAGANDVLLEPFEARELRIKAGLSPVAVGRRVDSTHGTAVPSETRPAASSSGEVPESALIAPIFDPLALRFVDPREPRLTGEGADTAEVVPVLLDRILTCPACGGLPTFRSGCPECGSAFCERETLIHHYACAHVGRESEFRHGTDMVCPKCRTEGLVAGADFEISNGGFVCTDCGTVLGELDLIGHCLSCQHRFPAVAAVVQELRGYRVSEHAAGQLCPPSGNSPGRRRPLRRQAPASI